MSIDARFYEHLGPFPLNNLLAGLEVDVSEFGSFAEELITNAMPLDQAASGDISFFAPSRGRKHPEQCGASVCITTAECAEDIAALGAFPIISKFPRADFARVLKKMYRSIPYADTADMVSEVHPTAIVMTGSVIGQGAKIGANTQIGINSVIGPNVIIGDDCVIGNNTVIEYSSLGDRCHIHHGAVIGSTGFGVAPSASGGVDIPHIGCVRLGNEVTIGCNTTIDRAMFGETRLDDGCKMDNQVQIAHNCHIGAHSMFAAHVGISGSCTIGAGVIMGGKAGVADHLTIGDGAVLAAGAATMHNIPAGEKWSGVPAQPIRNHMREVGALRRLVGKKSKKT